MSRFDFIGPGGVPNAFPAPAPNTGVGLFPPNSTVVGESTHSAVSAGRVKANTLISGPNDVGLQPLGSNQTPTLLSEMSEAGNNGTANVPQGGNANVGSPSTGGAGNPMNGGNPGASGQLTLNAPASSVTYATTGGNNNFGG
jgi:hypothetical protein